MLRRVGWVGAVGLVAMAGGCGWILGLDEFVDAPPAAGGGTGGQGGGGGGECEAGKAVACYEGPAETEGVGICVGGMKACGEDGAWGACEGAVTPRDETCANPSDEDCDGKDCVVWARMFGDVTAQSVGGIAAAPDGGIYVAGWFTGTLGFPPQAPISANGTDIYLAKLDAAGNGLWVKAFPTTFGQGDVGGLAVDAQGNVVITGTISGSTDFDGTVIDPYGYDSVYVAKLAADGALLWADIVFLDDTHEVARPAIDPDGNIVLLGTNTCVTCAPARTQLWIRTFGPDGVVLWTRAFNELDGAGSYTLGGVAADPFGNLIITAGFQGTATLGSWTFTSEGGNNVLVLKLDSQGNGVWSRKLGGAPVTSSDIVADAVGSIIMTGNFTGTVSLGASGPDITSGAAGDIFVVKLSSANALSWSRVFGDDELQRGGRLAMGPDDALSLTGGVVGSVDFGGGPLVARGESVALWKLSPEGAHLWSRLLGGQLASVVISAGADGTLLLGSAAVGDVDLGAGLLASAGDSDVLVGSFAR